MYLFCVRAVRIELALTPSHVANFPAGDAPFSRHYKKKKNEKKEKRGKEDIMRKKKRPVPMACALLINGSSEGRDLPRVFFYTDARGVPFFCVCL